MKLLYSEADIECSVALLRAALLDGAPTSVSVLPKSSLGFQPVISSMELISGPNHAVLVLAGLDAPKLGRFLYHLLVGRPADNPPAPPSMN